MMFHSINISKEKISLYLVFLFFIALTFFCCEIPFFWDECYYILTAHHIFDSKFSSIITSLQVDRGNFPFYGFYMALWWKIFGKLIIVSHFAMLPFLLGIVWEYYCLAKKILLEKWIPFAMLLLMLEPTLLTQSILMGHDIILIYFFLLSLRALLYGEKKLYTLAFCMLALHNIKGIPIAFALLIFYFLYLKFVQQKKITMNDLCIHFFPVISWLLWMVYHNYKTGWYILTPINDYGNGAHFDFSLLKRMLLGVWQIIDFGRIFLWLFIIVSLFYWREKTFSLPLKTILLLLLILTSVLLLFFALLDINLCHRYFVVIFLTINLLACFLISKTVRKKICEYLITVLLCTGLITGNFWLYGGGFSNGWDSSLKVLPYFKLINKMRDYTKTEKINPVLVGTKFPLHLDTKYSDLSSVSFHFTDIDTASFAKFPYILLSNVSNQFTVRDKETLNNEWILLKEYNCGQVYLKLFSNPNK